MCVYIYIYTFIEHQGDALREALHSELRGGAHRGHPGVELVRILIVVIILIIISMLVVIILIRIVIIVVIVIPGRREPLGDGRRRRSHAGREQPLM